jgi:uncharacterized protein YdeI (YjbR/CyaY-like superfamily)
MPNTDPRIDAYIARAAEFAQPILIELRARMHRACPDCEETLKWGMPAFLYQGRILATMAAFRQHCAFGFWRGREVVGEPTGEGMGDFGRIDSLADLPGRRAFSALVKKAMAVGQTPAPRKPRPAKKPPPEVPPALVAGLAGNALALAFFEALPPGHRREYCEWIAEAKQQATRERRVRQAVEWLAEGKTRHWKYQKG